MDYQLDCFAKRLNTFIDSHHQQFFPEYRLEVTELYDELTSLLDGEATLTMEDHTTSMDITIIAESFVSSKDFPALQDLIHAATVFDAKIQDNKILFVLHFRFWEWIPKESAN